MIGRVLCLLRDEIRGLCMYFIEEAWKYDAEYLSYVSDLINNEKLRKLDDIVHHHYTTRFKHSLYVSYVSYRVAKHFGLDAKATARAGLLHDFFLEGRDEIAVLEQGSHNFVHPKLALENAKELTEISKKEEDIILKHMFLCTKCSLPKYSESYVVTCIDKYCALAEVTRPMRDRVMEKISAVKGFLAVEA